MDAVAAARDVHQEAWVKLGKVIARKESLGRATEEEAGLRARASRKISFYNRLLIELEAAAVVVGVPTAEEIAQLRGLALEVKEIAVASAMVGAGLKLIRKALDESNGAVVGVKPG